MEKKVKKGPWNQFLDAPLNESQSLRFSETLEQNLETTLKNVDPVPSLLLHSFTFRDTLVPHHNEYHTPKEHLDCLESALDSSKSSQTMFIVDQSTTTKDMCGSFLSPSGATFD